MATGVPATIAADLIDKLNLLRIRHVDDWGNALAQVSFSVQALRSADVGAHLAVSSMIAALDGKLDDLEAIASRLTPKHDLTDRFNVLLSLSTAGCTERAWELAYEMIQEAHDREMVSSIADCVLSAGSLTRVLELADYRQRTFGSPVGELEEERIALSLLAAGIDDDTFGQFLRSIKGALREQGWLSAPVLLTECFNSEDGDSPVIAKIVITASAERALDVEEAFMDTMIAANDPIFMSGTVACSVSLAEGPHG